MSLGVAGEELGAFWGEALALPWGCRAFPGPSRHLGRVQEPAQIPWVWFCPELEFVLTPQLSHGCFERGCLVFAVSCTACLGLKAAVVRLFPKR